MEWTDEAIVLGLRRQGETSVVLELMTRAHGRHSGLVHGGRSRRMQAILQPGNGVHAVWRARIDEQLGAFVIEAGPARAARYLGSAMALYGLATLVGHLRLLPDRDPHPNLFETASVLADHLENPEVAPALFVRFELMVLAELGFGLDLARCAVTGRSDDLAYVSPRTGRAVGVLAGEAYRDRLLRLPAFLQPGAPGGQPEAADIAAGFTLASHFLDTQVYDPRGQPAPDTRGRFIGLALDAARAVTAGT